jgi:hypothetical protein
MSIINIDTEMKISWTFYSKFASHIGLNFFCSQPHFIFWTPATKPAKGPLGVKSGIFDDEF